MAPSRCRDRRTKVTGEDRDPSEVLADLERVLRDARPIPPRSPNVTDVDRLGRSLRHLIGALNDLAERGVGFRSLTEGFDTTTAGGRLLFNIMGSLAEFERDLIVERTQAGLAAARGAASVAGRR